jgi:hypothetical protein
VLCAVDLIELDGTARFRGVGNDIVRVGCQSWDDPKAILPDETLLVIALGKTL